jgi:hypothetical protein
MLIQLAYKNQYIIWYIYELQLGCHPVAVYIYTQTKTDIHLSSLMMKVPDHVDTDLLKSKCTDFPMDELEM